MLTLRPHLPRVTRGACALPMRAITFSSVKTLLIPKTTRRRVRLLSSMLSLLLIVLGTTGLASLSLGSAHAAAAAPANTAVPLYKNSQQLLGQYPNETTLTTSNVNTAGFGRVASFPVDGAVYAQPLFLPNVITAHGVYNLVIVATEHDSIYAFDADHATATPIWHTTFLVNGATSVPSTAVYTGTYVDISPEVGITGTPVVDQASGTLYVSAMTQESGKLIYRLHALDITSGHERAFGPVVEAAKIAGTGTGSVNGSLTFDPQHENQRGALLLLNGTVYVPFGSFADILPYHGWILGYNASTLAQTTVFNSTPDGGNGGIWESGATLAVDPTDNSLFVPVGNGTFNLNTGGASGGDSVLKLSATNGLRLTDYFTPFNQSCLNTADKDLGSSGTLILPAQSGAAHPNELVSAGKEGRIYLIDRAAPGKYTVVANPCNNQSVTTYDKVVQELPASVLGGGGVFGTPAYWNGVVYVTSNGGAMKALPLTSGLLATTAASKSPETFKFPGPNPVVSSNGTASGTGIVWVIAPPATCATTSNCYPASGGTLRAYDARNLGSELYSSSQNAARDGLASYVKFSVPTVANGQVFVGTAHSLEVFGLNPPPPPPTPTPPPVRYNNVGTSNDASPGSGNFDGISNSYSAQALQTAGVAPGAAVMVNNAQFTWPNAAAGTNNNYSAAGQVLPVTPVTGAQTLAFLGAAANGAQSGTAVINYADGTTQSFALSFSDWTLGGGSKAPLPSNTIAVKTAYRNTPTGKQTVQTDVFYADVALETGKTIQSVTLPTLGNLHVFAVSTTASAPATHLLPPYNNVGTSDDTKPGSGNFDGTRSYSAQALANAGVTPGAAIPMNDAQFIWPVAGAGTNNNYQAAGQVLPVTPVTGAQTLGFLGAAVYGAQSGTAVIRYTDGTTQNVTLAFSDWTLGGGTAATLPSNTIAVKTAYRNTPNGRDTVQTDVFYTDVALLPGKTIQSVKLPTLGNLHVFAVATTAQPPASTQAGLVPYNNVGTSDDAKPTTGNFDGSNSYSAEALQAAGVTPGTTVTVNNALFTWPNAAAGTNNNYRAAGQVLPVNPVTGARTLAFLGAAVYGTQTGTAIITYTDGTKQSVTLTFGDWTLNGGTTTLLSTNLSAITAAYRNTPTGKQSVKTYVFYTDVALKSGKTIQSVTLPTLQNLHVFAVSSTASAPATYVLPPYNNVGTSYDASPGSGNFDGTRSYSAQALQAAGVTPGATLTVNGVQFTWPSAAAGTNNNYSAAGQIVPLAPSSGETTLAFLGAGSNGAQSGTVTITYTDGTTQTVTLAFSDWTLGGGTATPLASNSIACTAAYRNTPGGRETVKTYVFYTAVTLQAGKTVQSVTLPTLGNLHVFAVATK